MEVVHKFHNMANTHVSPQILGTSNTGQQFQASFTFKELDFLIT